MSILISDIQCIDNRSKDEKAIRELAEIPETKRICELKQQLKAK